MNREVITNDYGNYFIDGSLIEELPPFKVNYFNGENNHSGTAKISKGSTDEEVYLVIKDIEGNKKSKEISTDLLKESILWFLSIEEDQQEEDKVLSFFEYSKLKEAVSLLFDELSLFSLSYLDREVDGHFLIYNSNDLLVGYSPKMFILDGKIGFKDIQIEKSLNNSLFKLKSKIDTIDSSYLFTYSNAKIIYIKNDSLVQVSTKEGRLQNSSVYEDNELLELLKKEMSPKEKANQLFESKKMIHVEEEDLFDNFF